MIIPSIDIQNGNAVQLVGGERKIIDAGDPWPIAEQFARVGEIAVIDLDAAMGVGNNSELIKALCLKYPCRVGGGIRDSAAAISWLDNGAQRVILGTAASPEVLEKLPKERVIAALDSRNNRVVVEGWNSQTEYTVELRMQELNNFVSGFLVTFVEHEGRMEGIPIDRAHMLLSYAGDTKITVAGGVREASEVAELDRLGIDTQVGMALYTGAIELSQGLTACMSSDRSDRLWPTVVCDEHGTALGLVYSSPESVAESIRTGTGVYYSRSRGALWRKGVSSGNSQDLLKIKMDCDRDALQFIVKQSGSGFCHRNEWTCFGENSGLPKLERTILQRINQSPEGSYTRRLIEDPSLLDSKLREEINELIHAKTKSDLTHEAADALYFLLTKAIYSGTSLADIERELDRRSLTVSRRPGNAKALYQETEL